METCLGPTLLTGLHQLATLSDTAPVQVLTAAVALVLRRYSDQDDLCVAYRLGAESRRFLRLMVEPDASFVSLLARARQAPQEAPGEDVDESLEGVCVCWGQDGIHSPRSARLVVGVGELAGAFVSWIEYDQDAFERHAIQRFAGHLGVLVSGAAAQPQAPVGVLPLLTPAERLQFAKWNDTAHAPPADQTIHGLFEQQVALHPTALAIVYEEARWTYTQLNQHANRLAHLLLDRVGSGARVGVCLERSPETVAALLAILKTGGAFLPLDPSHPRERLAFMVSDAGLAAIVTHAQVRERLPGDLCPVVCLDGDAEGIAACSDQDPRRTVASTDLCRLTYTSGSTGVAKAVIADHAAPINAFSWMWRTCPFDAHEVGCHRSPLSYVVSLWEIFQPLLAGVPVVVVPDLVAGDPQALVEHLAHHAVTRVLMVPSQLAVLLDGMPELRERLPSVNHWIVTGEPTPAALAARFLERMPGVTLFNMYGSSEADAVCGQRVQPGSGLGNVPVGRPISNRRVYLLDERRQLVPVGVPGEVYVGGVGIAHGYVNRPDLTRSRFLADPVGDSTQVVFRTGDRASYLEDGSILHLGRVDDQVKIRGHRVEPAEVEAVLGAHPEVDRCAVVARLDESDVGGARLVAYAVASSARPTVTSLRDHMGATLPAHMIPSAFVFMESL
ncbi:amino acid adenylation domain-containing protein, partial [Planctomycetota bacterium]|nr:amino acid adenylation domain-containing protein [Planctomycetota bacterium]